MDKPLHIRKMQTFGASNVYYAIFHEGNIAQPLFLLTEGEMRQFFEEYQLEKLK